MDYSELPSSRFKNVKDEKFAKGTEQFMIFVTFWKKSWKTWPNMAGRRFKILDKAVANLEHHGCPKVQDLFDEEIWICSRYLFRHTTTLNCDECKTKLFDNGTRQHLKL